jgi:hypothetical protein
MESKPSLLLGWAPEALSRSSGAFLVRSSDVVALGD